MGKNANFVSHKKSKQIVDGKPKLPLASDLVEGEIAINFGKDVETLSIKNESGDVVTFSSDNYYTEKKLGSGFTGENSAVTVTDTILWESGTGENAIVQKGGGNTASGKLSVAMGSDTTASGDYSVAEGLNTTASGNYSHTEGWSTNASGLYSHAEGGWTLVSGQYSHAEGEKTSATSYDSHAEGRDTLASGDYSHAEGYATTASGYASHAEGAYTKASDYYSHAEGNNTTANGNSSHAEGYLTKANSDYSHAEGTNTVASGSSSHAEGSYTYAIGDYSHAEGTNTVASGNYSHAEGSQTSATTYEAHAEGWKSIASGSISHAEGNNTIASGGYSHSEGYNTTASGESSHAEGNNTIANNQSEHASGQYNVSSSASTTFGDSGNTLFSVGNGTADNARHNSFEIRQNGDIYITSGGTVTSSPIKLQDYIGGGGSITVDQVIDSGTSASTNAVATKAVYNKIVEDEQVWAISLNQLNNNKFGYANFDGTSKSIEFYRDSDEILSGVPISTVDLSSLSIDIDQVIDSGTSASTNPVSTKAVYKVVTDNELVLTNTFIALSGAVSSHTENTDIHVTAADKTAWNAKLDASAYTPTDLSNYYTKSETSGATEISNAFAQKLNISNFNSYSGAVDTAISLKASESDLTALSGTVTGHTSNANIHLTTTEKTNLDSLATNIGTISGITSTDKLIHETMNRRTRTDFTSKGLEWFKTTLKSAIADKSLEKYGLKVGDYYTVTHGTNTYNYVIAGLNTMRGTSTPYRLNYDHVGIIVDTNDTHAWNTAGNTHTSQNTHSTDGTWTTGTAAAGYASCDLQYYLEDTVLKNVETDLGASNLKAHTKLYSTAVNTSGYNRFGSAGGCSSSWAWYPSQKICALSEVQVYGSIVWSSSGYDTGEACRQLDVFRVYNMNEIFGGRYPWLRDVASASNACTVLDGGFASLDSASLASSVAALILFA